MRSRAVARDWLWVAMLVALTWLAGCATHPRLSDAALERLPARAELEATPFFAQDRFQCGPASLATALTAAGHAADPKQLEPGLFLPQREGALQVEMLAAARRQGALALPAPRDLAGLLSVVAAGRPVVVLQNLGLTWAPRWHYAVVIGYDLPRSQVILRSGTTRREVMPMSTFDYTWARSGRWGLLVSPPGELPVSALQSDVELALAALERFSSAPTMIQHYQTAAYRWPDSLLLWIGLGNMYARAQHLDAAELALRRAAERHPRSAIVLNNLASVLQARGKWDEALSVADRALEAARGSQWQEHAQATRDGIRAAIQASAPSNGAPNLRRPGISVRRSSPHGGLQDSPQTWRPRGR